MRTRISDLFNRLLNCLFSGVGCLERSLNGSDYYEVFDPNYYTGKNSLGPLYLHSFPIRVAK